MIAPDAFVREMQKRWIELDPENVYSPALLATWRRVCETFNAQATTPALRHPVVPAELGAGKTTCAKVWCAMLPTEGHPGVLIVARSIEQAVEYADTINIWAKAPVAFAYHSKLPLSERENTHALAQWPVVVICHRQYEIGLDKLAVNESYERFDHLHAWREGHRRLVIIDEALELVHESRVSRGNLKSLIDQIPRQVETKHQGAMRVLYSVYEALREAPDHAHQTITVEALLRTARVPLPEADVLLEALGTALGQSQKLNPRTRAKLRQLIAAIRRHLASYRWISGERKTTTLSGPRLLLLPPTAQGVLLDATARLNNVYRRRPDVFDILDLPLVRDYSTVTIYEARTRGTGKGNITLRSREKAAETLTALIEHYGDQARERRVLVVVAKDARPSFEASPLRHQFKEYAVAHWNAIDGRNDWSKFDTLVVASLHYGSRSQDPNVYMAAEGIELDDIALNRPPADVRQVRELRIAATLAQAVGRIRLRSMVDPQGGCLPCDVFLRLPSWRYYVDADAILGHLRLVLPGVQVKPWPGAHHPLRREGRPSRVGPALEAALLACAEALPVGATVKAKVVRELAKVGSHDAWAQCFRRAADPASTLHQALTKLGARVEVGTGGFGRDTKVTRLVR